MGTLTDQVERARGGDTDRPGRELEVGTLTDQVEREPEVGTLTDQVERES